MYPWGTKTGAATAYCVTPSLTMNVLAILEQTLMFSFSTVITTAIVLKMNSTDNDQPSSIQKLMEYSLIADQWEA